jgi:hypothetical protein
MSKFLVIKNCEGDWSLHGLCSSLQKARDLLIPLVTNDFNDGPYTADRHNPSTGEDEVMDVHVTRELVESSLKLHGGWDIPWMEISCDGSAFGVVLDLGEWSEEEGQWSLLTDFYVVELEDS